MGYFYDRYKTNAPQAAPVARTPVSPLPPPRVGVRQVLQEAPRATMQVGRGILDFFTKNTQNLVNTAGKNIGEAAAYHTDPNVRKQVEGGNLPTLTSQQTQLIQRLRSTPKTDPKRVEIKAALIGLNEDLKREGSGFKNVLSEQGSVSSTGEGLKKIAGQAIGSAAELGSFAKGAQLAQGAQKFSLGRAALTGAKSGATYGGLFGASGALQENKSAMDIGKSTLFGAGTGAAVGGALGALLGKISQGRTKTPPNQIAKDTATYTAGVQVSKPAAKPLGNPKLDKILVDSIDNNFGPLKDGKAVGGVYAGMQITDPSGKLIPQAAEGRIQDIALKIEKDFGEKSKAKFMASVKPENVTIEQLRLAAQNAVDSIPVPQIAPQLQSAIPLSRTVPKPQAISSGPIPQPKKSVPYTNAVPQNKETVNPLLTEARKYKSAEEFAKSQKTIYHGTPKTFNKFDNSKSYTRSTWFSDSKKATLANDVEATRPPGSKWNVMERHIKPGTKLLDTTTKEGAKMHDNLMTQQVIDLGYRGVKYPADSKRGQYIELFFPNEDTITKSQLTDIWNKSRGGQPFLISKERGAVTSIQKAPNISAETKAGVSGQYTPKPNEQLMGEAKALLSEGASIDFKGVQNVDRKVAATIQDAINADAAGNHQAAANLYNNLSKHGTELGRGVQAYSMIPKMSPEAISLTAAGKIRSYNATSSKKIPELTGEQQKILSKGIDKIRGLPEGRQKNIAMHDLNETMNDFIPSSFVDKGLTVWKAGLLTSLRTHERNMLGNAIHGGTEILKDPVSVVNDMLLRAKTGQRTTTFSLKSGEYGKKGLQSSKDMLLHGFDPEKSLEGFDVGRHITWEKTPTQQFLKKATGVIFNTLGAEDKVFYNYALGRSLYDQAGAAAINAGKRGDAKFIEALVKNPPDEIIDTAVKDASRAVFKNENLLREVASATKQKLSKNEYAKFAGEFLAPFTGVPSSIAGEIAAYSPIGLTRGLVNDVKILFSKSTNPALQRAAQREASQQVGRGAVGTGILAAGVALAKKGLLTGEPKDQKEAEQWEIEGKQRNSVLVGGKWRSINSIGPEAILLLAGGEFGRQARKKTPFSEAKSTTDRVLDTAGYLGKVFTNQTFLAGVQQPLNVITDPIRFKPARYAGSLIGSFIPNLVKDAGKSLDPLQRESNTIMDTVKSGIPGLRNTLLPKRDVLGKELPNEATGLTPFVDLFNSKTPINDPVVNELSRLYGMGLSATPSKQEKTQSLFGAKIILNPKLLDTLEKESGGKVTFVLNRLVATPGYQAASDEQKKKLIDTVVDTIRKSVKTTQLLPILKEKVQQ